MAQLGVNPSTATQPDAKCFIPLESGPPVLTDLMYDLGVSTSLALVDVMSIEDPTLLGVISRPALALILVLPTSDEYERHRRSTKRMVEVAEDPNAEEVIWFRQTIDNACGLYAILHAICNFGTKDFIGMSVTRADDFFALTESHRIEPNSFLSNSALAQLMTERLCSTTRQISRRFTEMLPYVVVPPLRRLKMKSICITCASSDLQMAQSTRWMAMQMGQSRRIL